MARDAPTVSGPSHRLHRVRLTKNGSVAGRPRGVALSRECTSAAGVAGQLQPLVRRTAKPTGTGPTGTATLRASRNRGRKKRSSAFEHQRTLSGLRRPEGQRPPQRLHRVRLTKSGSVAGRPRRVALSREYASAAGVAGQLQPLVRSHGPPREAVQDDDETDEPTKDERREHEQRERCLHEPRRHQQPHHPAPNDAEDR